MKAWVFAYPFIV